MAIDGIAIGCLFLRDGNRHPRPKFDYKLAWFELLLACAMSLLESGYPAMLVADLTPFPPMKTSTIRARRK